MYAFVQVHGHLEGLQQTPVSPILQLVLLSCLAQTQRGLALSVQLVMEVVQQRSSRSPLESIHTHKAHVGQHRVGDYGGKHGRS